MNKVAQSLSILLVYIIISLSASFAQVNDPQVVPIGGNTWQIAKTQSNSRIITNEGIRKWDNSKAAFKTFFRVGTTGSLKLWINASAVAGGAVLDVKIGEDTRQVTLEGSGFSDTYVGEWNLADTGYVEIELKGVSKEGRYYPSIASYKIAGTAVDERTQFVKNNEGNFFYWGRRGPSVHMRYPVPEKMEAKWYYNEITVPEGEDVVGSYYMANGFNGGYFGIQVNSETERRILFSVWSPYVTDNPDEIPEDQKIKLLKKGEDVYTGEFGNEGSGGQSFLRYNWKAGNTYKFLLKGQPVGNDHTEYSAWFFAPEEGEWRLIASFSRPKTNSWLTGFHSFLENFSPQQGVFEREVLFSNQWVGDKNNNWTELTEGVFSADNTARTGYRIDYAGGEKNGSFFLRNCGFFDDYTPIGASFTRRPTKEKPEVDLNNLP